MSAGEHPTMLAIGLMLGTIVLCPQPSICISPSTFTTTDPTLPILSYNGSMLTGVSILPALAFSLDMFQKTGSNYGVNEVLLASVLGSVVFSLFAAQPLVIVGVTGMLCSSYTRLHNTLLTLLRTHYCFQLVSLILCTLYEIKLFIY